MYRLLIYHTDDTVFEYPEPAQTLHDAMYQAYITQRNNAQIQAIGIYEPILNLKGVQSVSYASI